MFGCCGVSNRGQTIPQGCVNQTNVRQNETISMNPTDTYENATAPPLDALVVGGTNLNDISTQMQLQTDEELRRNEELYAQQLLQQNQLSQIVDTKHQGTLAKMRQMTQFAETDKQNRSTQGILDQAKKAELEALKKHHQEALLPDDPQKKTLI